MAAITLAAAGESYVVTTGTGSGKSLCYFIPIVSAVLQEKYGMIDGVVSRIAADAVHPQANREQETGAERVDLSPYKAVVQLRNQTLGEHTVWPLAPGMEVAAEIREGQRTVLEYLLSPVSKAAHEAGRER
jgi:membrane fusion protein, hemolysin D